MSGPSRLGWAQTNCVEGWDGERDRRLQLWWPFRLVVHTSVVKGIVWAGEFLQGMCMPGYCCSRVQRDIVTLRGWIRALHILSDCNVGKEDGRLKNIGHCGGKSASIEDIGTGQPSLRRYNDRCNMLNHPTAVLVRACTVRRVTEICREWRVVRTHAGNTQHLWRWIDIIERLRFWKWFGRMASRKRTHHQGFYSDVFQCIWGCGRHGRPRK